ncbi:hypothetical protein ACFV23_33270, partial [Streptomyces sp. NPDC059627]
MTAMAGQPTAGSAKGTVASATMAAGKSVTLITGDKVSLDSAGHVVRMAPGKGRKGMTFQIRQTHGHVYVLPGDAQSLLGKGTLDRRLFDVKELVADGYDDAHRSDLPLVVTYAKSQGSALQPLKSARKSPGWMVVWSTVLRRERSAAAVERAAVFLGRGRVGGIGRGARQGRPGRGPYSPTA